MKTLKYDHGIALREIAIIIAILVVLVLLALPLIRNTMQTNLTRTCQGNLQEWATIFALYRAENGHYNPPVHGYETFGSASKAAGCANIDDAFDLAPDVRLIFPNYATDPTILACPDAGGVIPARTIGPVVVARPHLDPNVFGVAEGSCADSGAITRPGAGYTYFGYEMRFANDKDPQISEDQARLASLPATGPANIVAMLKRYEINKQTDLAAAQASRGVPFNRGDYMAELAWPYVPHGGDLEFATVMPLNDVALEASKGAGAVIGLDISEIMARMPTIAVMWDAIHQNGSGEPVFNHDTPQGCNILYMDGHVEFKPYPGEFPVSKSFATMRAVR